MSDLNNHAPVGLSNVTDGPSVGFSTAYQASTDTRVLRGMLKGKRVALRMRQVSWQPGRYSESDVADFIYGLLRDFLAELLLIEGGEQLALGIAEANIGIDSTPPEAL